MYDFKQKFQDPESVKFIKEDPDVRDKLTNCKKLSMVNAGDYDVIFYVGGEIFVRP